MGGRSRPRAGAGPVFATSVLVRARSDSCPEGTWDLHFLPGSRSGRRLADECRRLPAEAGFARLGHPAHTRRPGSTGRRPWLSRGGDDAERLGSGVGIMRALAEAAGAAPSSGRALRSRSRPTSDARFADLPPHRHMRDRSRRRCVRRRARRRRALCGGRFDHADDPSCEHEPEHDCGCGANRGLASRLSRPDAETARRRYERTPIAPAHSFGCRS